MDSRGFGRLRGKGGNSETCHRRPGHCNSEEPHRARTHSGISGNHRTQADAGISGNHRAPADTEAEENRANDGEGNRQCRPHPGHITTNGNGLRVTQWNTQGARHKIHLLHEAAGRDGADVFLLQETLVPASKPVRLRGYTTYSVPHSRGGPRGTAILVRNNIPSSPVQDPIYCGERVEVMAVKILLHQTQLTIYNIYNPPTGTLNVGELFASAALQPTFIAGDFNSHHPVLHSPGNPNIIFTTTA